MKRESRRKTIVAEQSSDESCIYTPINESEPVVSETDTLWEDTMARHKWRKAMAAKRLLKVTIMRQLIIWQHELDRKAAVIKYGEDAGGSCSCAICSMEVQHGNVHW